MFTHTYRHAVMMSERRDHELKENRDGHMGGHGVAMCVKLLTQAVAPGLVASTGFHA